MADMNFEKMNQTSNSSLPIINPITTDNVKTSIVIIISFLFALILIFFMCCLHVVSITYNYLFWLISFNFSSNAGNP